MAEQDNRTQALATTVRRLSIQGTFLGPFETSAGVTQPTGAKVDFPTADFWYVRDGS